MTERTEFARATVIAAIRRGGLNWKPAGPLPKPAQAPRPAPRLA